MKLRAGDKTAAQKLSQAEINPRISAIAEGRSRFDQRFERWHAALAPLHEEPDFMWAEGATETQIRELEEAVDAVPADLRRLLIRHNGQSSDIDATPLYFVNRLLATGDIVFQSKELNDINIETSPPSAEIEGEPAVEDAGWWHPDLLLFLTDDNGGGVAVDRYTGSVWDWDHDGGLFGQLAPSIGTFFEWIAIALEEKRFKSDGEGLIWIVELDPVKARAGTESSN